MEYFAGEGWGSCRAGVGIAFGGTLSVASAMVTTERDPLGEGETPTGPMFSGSLPAHRRSLPLNHLKPELLKVRIVAEYLMNTQPTRYHEAGTVHETDLPSTCAKQQRKSSDMVCVLRSFQLHDRKQLIHENAHCLQPQTVLHQSYRFYHDVVGGE